MPIGQLTPPGTLLASSPEVIHLVCKLYKMGTGNKMLHQECYHTHTTGTMQPLFHRASKAHSTYTTWRNVKSADRAEIWPGPQLKTVKHVLPPAQRLAGCSRNIDHCLSSSMLDISFVTPCDLGSPRKQVNLHHNQRSVCPDFELQYTSSADCSVRQFPSGLKAFRSLNLPLHSPCC